MKEIVALVFGFAMIINACLFIPQVWHLWKTKSSQGISITAFAGFNALQLVGAVHGYFQRDYALFVGMLATLLTCGSVTLLAARYRPNRRVNPVVSETRPLEED